MLVLLKLLLILFSNGKCVLYGVGVFGVDIGGVCNKGEDKFCIVLLVCFVLDVYIGLYVFEFLFFVFLNLVKFVKFKGVDDIVGCWLLVF